MAGGRPVDWIPLRVTGASRVPLLITPAWLLFPASPGGSHVWHFDPECADCKCEIESCPEGTFTGPNGECRCHREGSSEEEPDYNSACQGSGWCRRATTEVSEKTGLLLDWFYPTCENCNCCE